MDVMGGRLDIGICGYGIGMLELSMDGLRNGSFKCV